MPPELAGAVERVFGERADLARRYAEHLATSAVERGLVGPREVGRIWERHVLNCAVVGELLPQGAAVVDVGSGAGLPGLCLALARPDAAVVLVEPLERRMTWLREVVDDLALPVAVVRGRAEEVAGTGRVPPADVVTARAVAPLERLARWCLPLLRPGGALLALKGRTAAEELAAARPVLRRLGAVSEEVVTAGAGVVPGPTTIVRATVGPGRGPAGSRGRRTGSGRAGRG
ncbi:16S rRNA (guanine(527)-N(7))-methyltransferase RsmG [Quadrisphaera sp. DSM 44207]|uniref:16S rRNA (guanine(527)-N(7))-methyltransferase RsmG n=1 Tax=Quadrisphaera sp. DSM 44207 TaxID=1881057 RepID=UPI00088EB325|nr:16S rRNA (guanine(527)-N(7))-methyltransferase RsmG [Quadrisphaera sp. DSM 44207]SDQ23272.1 16S rRNA (guanine527-N7)-methyltransferase [Quadrisphaera sp. DSM 44207]